ncbi:organic hydroperoxide resistance protein [Nonomuraea gerenzanensis]|uniref:Organic hydroperoxide resistance protein n=1 Tax=Nonomuraea gerenzanensis TaxID=93944 RepID=A0A1M4E1E8_9ACTN|nr:organic hydroperoxide resistance protein [Nonomuraea gerenzanensis]UBU14897.1 organic hydroperoxide resistance protein [Nonomuraea gerenzanensis]SBO92632.1 Organic hydroperoxide resistance protein [Nonomuraea gerenzanensis]
MAVSYTGVVTVTGEGRNGGRIQADDGMLDTTLAIPKELGGAGGATNPEQLFAAGWGACFLGAVRRAAAQRKIKLTSTAITVEATLNHGEDGEFGLSAVLNLELGGVDQPTAEELGAAAHQLCPYSKATRGNIPVTINAKAA